MESVAAASSSLDPAMSMKEEECPSPTTEDVGKTSGRFIESSKIVARSSSDVWNNCHDSPI
jgi:hypothetical protein